MRFLDAKCAKNAFLARADPGEGSNSVPSDPLARFDGSTSKERGREGEGGGGKEESGGGKQCREAERGREGEGAYRYFFFPTLSPGNK